MADRTNKKPQTEESNFSCSSSWLALTMLASSTALPGKAKPGASIWGEAFRKLIASGWITSIITGVGSLASGYAIGSGGGSVYDIALRAATAGILAGGVLLVISYWIVLAYVAWTPP